MKFALALCAVAVLASACGKKPPEVPKASEPELVTDSWVGRWIGPEGLFLDISTPKPGSGVYQMTLKDNLDSQADYQGRDIGEMIQFSRKGRTETLRPGSGKDTGFKTLVDKTDCLIVVQNQEGYCRD